MEAEGCPIDLRDLPEKQVAGKLARGYDPVFPGWYRDSFSRWRGAGMVYKGYRVVDQGEGNRTIVSPIGISIAGFVYSWEDWDVYSIADNVDVDGGRPYKTPEEAFKYIVRNHELATTTRSERFWQGLSQVLSHGGWKAVAVGVAILAFILSALRYCGR